MDENPEKGDGRRAKHENRWGRVEYAFLVHWRKIIFVLPPMSIARYPSCDRDLLWSRFRGAIVVPDRAITFCAYSLFAILFPGATQ